MAKKKSDVVNTEDVEKSWQTFLTREENSRDTIIVKKEFVDLVGDLHAGILLSQIIYWLLPSKKSKIGTKLRIQRNGDMWLAKKRADWWDEIRLTEKQYDRAIKTLKNYGIVETQIFKFMGDAVVHIKVNKAVFLAKLDEKNETTTEIRISPNRKSRLPQTGNPDYPKQEILNKHRVQTESTPIIAKAIIGVSENGNTENKIFLSDDKILDCSVDNQQSTELRAKSKEYGAKLKAVNKAKELITYQCPSTVQPFIDYWMNTLNKTYKKNSVYESDCKALHKIILGQWFTAKTTPCIYNEYFGYKLTLEDWKKAVDHFKIISINLDYYPKNKQVIKNLPLISFLYSSYTKLDIKSRFLICLTEEPKLIKPAQVQIKDPDPVMTDTLIRLVKESIGIDLDNGNRNVAIKCHQRLVAFFNDYEPKLGNQFFHYRYWTPKVKTLIAMLLHYQEKWGKRPELFYFTSDKTFTEFLPEQLRREGTLPENNAY